jgi:hypothetical protein
LNYLYDEKNVYDDSLCCAIWIYYAYGLIYDYWKMRVVTVYEDEERCLKLLLVHVVCNGNHIINES